MFEVIQADGQHLRFDDSHYWEYFSEESASAPDMIKEDRTVLRVYRLNADDERELVTTIFKPLRVDSVTEHTALNPMFRPLLGTKCNRCGNIEY